MKIVIQQSTTTMTQTLEEIQVESMLSETADRIESQNGKSEIAPAKNQASEVDKRSTVSWWLKALFRQIYKIAYVLLLLYIGVMLSSYYGSPHALAPLTLPRPIDHNRESLESYSPPEIDSNKLLGNQERFHNPFSGLVEKQSDEVGAEVKVTTLNQKDNKKSQTDVSMFSQNPTHLRPHTTSLTKIAASSQQDYEQFKTKIKIAPHLYLDTLDSSPQRKKHQLTWDNLPRLSSRVLNTSKRESIIVDYLAKHNDDESMWLSYLLETTPIALQKRVNHWRQEKLVVPSSDEESEFCIVVNSFNNAHHQQIQRTLQSISVQKYTNYRVILVDRGSTDQTLSIVDGMLDRNRNLAEKMTVLRKGSMASLQGTYEGVKQCLLQQIVVTIDGNSQFLGYNVLKLLHSRYQRKVRAVYSGSFSLDTATKTVKQEEVEAYDESENFMLLYRLNPKKFASLFSFRMSVMSRINQSHLAKNDEWYDVTGNDALAFAVLEASCGKAGVIKDPLLLHQVDSEVERELGGKIQLQRIRIAEESKIDIC